MSHIGGKDTLTAVVRAPGNATRPAKIVDNANGTYQVEFIPMVDGAHHVHMAYEGIDLAESPLTVYAKVGCDPKRCALSGDGLRSALVGVPSKFVISTRGAGNGSLAMQVVGPDCRTQVNDNGDGTVTVEYVCHEPGDYEASVRFNDMHIPGSPFHFTATRPINAKVVRAYGDGVTAPLGNRAGVERRFNVDATQSGRSQLQVNLGAVSKETGKEQHVGVGEVTARDNGLYDVSYKVPDGRVGDMMRIHITYDGAPIQDR